VTGGALRRTVARAIAATVLLAASSAGVAVAGAETPTTVPGQRAQADAQVDTLRASREQVLARISELTAAVDAERAQAEASRVQADGAAAEADAAQRAADAAAAVAARNRDEFRSYVVQTFIRPPAQDALALLSLPADEGSDHAVGMLRSVADRRRATADDHVRQQRAAERTRDAARTAETDARRAQQSADAAASELQSAIDQQSTLAGELDQRLDAALAEAESLRQIDAEAARRLAAEEAALRQQGPRSTGAAPVGPVAVVDAADIVVVRGIPIHRSIADELDAMLASAAADGVTISGSGYRNSRRQIELRVQNCGSSPFDIYQRSPAECAPPTARPGTSMHERGLAVDLTSGGRAITSRADPAFVWLAANAGRFGFRNLPSEPWHWSTTGS
jgi:hypothetical protein